MIFGMGFAPSSSQAIDWVVTQTRADPLSHIATSAHQALFYLARKTIW
jgi:hypothetical protein